MFFKSLLLLIASEAARSSAQAGNAPCDAIKAAGLASQLLLPSDEGYESRLGTWWAVNTRLHPWCIFLPRDTASLSTGLTALLDGSSGSKGTAAADSSSTTEAAAATGEDWHVSVKSGGHMAWAGSNNVENGVAIDLGWMNATTYDADTNVARLQPGARWASVYAVLEDEYGVAAVGGRDGDVGVGGYLLGGGLSYHTPSRGFGFDSVVNYEVVLANGTVVDANETAHSDLYRALKGGGGNLGIVTRFDVEALPSTELYYDIRFVSSDYVDDFVDMVVGFADNDPSLGANSVAPFLTYDPSNGGATTLAAIYVNSDGDGDAMTTYSRYKEIPAITNITMRQTMAEATADSDLGRGSSIVGGALTFMNDPKIMHACIQYHDELVSSLLEAIGPDSFSTALFLQPLPSYIGKIGQARGGSVIGVDRWDENAIILSPFIIVSADDDGATLAKAQPLVKEMLAKIAGFAESAEGLLEWIYMNYADASQDVLGSYGKENVRFLKETAAKYDPVGVFQTLFPGGYKIGLVS